MKISPSLLRRIGPPLAMVFGLALVVPAFSQAVTGTSLSITGGGASTLSGTLSVTGATTLSNSLNVTGAIDSDNNQFTFGTQSASYGAGFIYADNSLPLGTADTFKFSLNRSPASWLWVHNTNIPAMRLDGNHQLTLFRSDGTTAGLIFTPQTGVLKLGTNANATLTGSDSTGAITSAGGLIVTGAFTASGGITNATGSLTGGSTGLTLNAGGTNQNVTITPSGTGSTVINGAVGLGVLPVGNYRLEVLGVPKFYPVAGGDNAVLLGAGGQSTGKSGLAIGYNQTYNGIAMSNSAYLQAETQGSGYRNILLDPIGGNVGIGTTSPQRALHVSGPGYTEALFESTAFPAGTIGRTWGIGNTATGALSIRALDSTLSSANGVMVLTNTGGVGIGTTTPAYTLDVNGLGQFSGGTQIGNGATVGLFNDAANLALRAPTSAGAGDIYFQTTNGSTTNMIVKNGGNVGIGTVSPAALLQVGTTIGNQGFKVGLFSNAANSNAEIRTSLSVVGADSTSVSASGAVAWDFYNGGVSPSWSGTLMEFFGSGMTGNLYGLPAANQAALIFQNASRGVIASNSANIFVSPAGNVSTTFLSNGNVGIGTTAPTATLHVVGQSGVDVPATIQSQTHNAYISLINVGGSNSISASDNGLYIGGGGVAGAILFRNGWTVNMIQTAAGNVGIGTTNPTQKLSVAGTIRAYAVVVDTGWSDYVFDENYRLAPLSEVEQTIKAQKHLPGIPSAQEVAAHGVSMGEMESKLLAKVEELTLHLIAQEKEINSLRHEVAELKTASVNP